MSGMPCCMVIWLKCTYVHNLHTCVKLIKVMLPVKKKYSHTIRVGFWEDVFSERAAGGSSCFFVPCNAVFLELPYQVPETLLKIVRKP
jgi:hypothetical protein